MFKQLIKQKSPLRLAGLFLLAILVLSGCTVKSGPKVFDTAEETGFAPVDEEKEAVSLLEAIQHTQSDLVEKFWFRAHIANNIEKRRTTYMTVNGIVIRPHGYYMHNRLVAQPFEYYRWDDQVYIRHEEEWYPGREPSLPFDVFYGFQFWEPYVEKARLVGEDEVLSIPTHVYEIELNGRELLDMDVPMFGDLKRDMEKIEALIEETRVRVLFYVGQVEKSNEQREILPIIYKYQTWIQMPIPGAGFMEQEVQHFIFRVNEDNVEMNSVEEIEKYLVDYDEMIKRMEEKLAKEAEKYIH